MEGQQATLDAFCPFSVFRTLQSSRSFRVCAFVVSLSSEPILFVRETKNRLMMRALLLVVCLTAASCFFPLIDAFAPGMSLRQQQRPAQQLSDRPHSEDDGTGAAPWLSDLRQNAAAALADGQTKDFKFPPIDFSDKNRCVLKSSSMGQANAARDSLFDLRQCDLRGVKAVGYDLSGAGELVVVDL